MTLIAFVVLYLLITVAIGLYAAARVKNTADFAVAGRSLPLIMVITTTFATWFGSETVLGVPAKFIEGGLQKTVEDPFGAAFCLIFVGMFFAAKLYRLKLITIGSFYRERYGKGVEIFSSAVIMVSYLGWVAAQITALGLVFTLLSGGAITTVQGMIIGTAVVLTYTVFGGMWSVALTDFFQMLIIIAGLALIAWFAAGLAGGADKVVAYAASKDMFQFFPELSLHAWLFWISAAITIMIGSIPQQDVFQRVMSAKNVQTAVRGPIIGGLSYLAFSFVPMFIGVAAFLVMPEIAQGLLAEDSQRILPTLVMEKMPVWLQVLFFGALLSAIMSTASATLLAPSTTFVENILKNFTPLSDRKELKAMRVTLVLFSLAVLGYSIIMEGTPIYELVAMAYQFPVVGAFWPLVCGLYWKRSTTQGAVWSIVLGMTSWLLLSYTPLGEVFPSVLGGFIMAGVGMLVGSLLPTQGNRAHHAAGHHARVHGHAH
ncbi:MAG: sodium:solute symporter family protein [Burkholderiales bacterium]|jgi:SSS family transporter|nr:sodium:solute symporter family protein [Burkholderiales bacterium]